MRKSVLLSTLAMPAIIHSAAYANTISAIIPDIYEALDVVSRELVGFIPSVNTGFGAERAAVGQAVKYPVAPTLASVNITPAMVVPEPTDFTMNPGTLTITKSKAVPFGFTGEENRGIESGPGRLTAQGLLVAQALRTLTNEMELDLAVAAQLGASRAYGTAGTTPFASDLAGLAQVRKILDDNGATPSMRSLVMNTSAGANLRTLQNLTRVSEAGTSMTLRQGELLEIHNISLKESAQVVNFTKGTAAGSTTNAAGYAAGATTITLAAAGTGTILAGDVITFAGDANKYVVATGDSDVSNGGSIVLAAPGLRQAIPASATAITVGGNYAANIAFSQDAIALVARPPALPDEGDLAIDRMMITDPRSGLTFELSVYAGYRKVRLELAMAWGVKVTKTENVAILLG